MAVCSDSSPGGGTAPPKSAATLRERLAEIESEMAPLQARLAHLATARKLIVDALESIVFPILTIPPEITTEFFMHYVDWVNGDPRTRRGGPLVLASVCSSWRSIALNFPKIWSEIHISNLAAGLPGVEKRVRCWLQRVGDHALAIDMTSSHTPQSIFNPLLAPYSMQWETFMCSVEVPYPLDEIEGRVPLLRTLSIESNIPQTLITAFSNAPLLREARLVFVFIALPWAITLNLEVLTVAYFNDSRTNPVTSVHCRLDRLRSFTFEHRFSGFPYPPALTHLEVAKQGMRPASHLLSFIERSRCLLRSLSFSLIDSEPTHDNAVEIIRCTRGSVTELSMQITTRADARRLLERITELLPNLRKLCIKTWDHPDKVEIVGHGGCGSTEGCWTADRWLHEIQFVAQQHSAQSAMSRNF
ncbi:hypothetical protein GGX14DRAFT_596871 [Mycena pura]|uniref:F-box domain-containing protein n=1 Tax=Mycena pura TaxID=153505 RepID=A0AAD6UPG7_9AGAR|nr:hypothetical protein GGX14DRAFT_596871 [Mycena pura]